MSAARSLRVALLTHSTNPRGGVVHTLEIADALTRLGHRVTVFAPDATGRGFFRPAFCETRSIPVAPADKDVLAMVEQRVGDYLDYFDAGRDDFDIWHAQDASPAMRLRRSKRKAKSPALCVPCIMLMTSPTLALSPCSAAQSSRPISC